MTGESSWGTLMKDEVEVGGRERPGPDHGPFVYLLSLRANFFQLKKKLKGSYNPSPKVPNFHGPLCQQKLFPSYYLHLQHGATSV